MTASAALSSGTGAASAPAGRGFRLRPGVAVAVQPQAAIADPRMDVALFLGFAAKGPLHRPVIIDSAASFAAVFGGPAPLAADKDGGIITTALAGTVAAFFAAGGTRCHVVRLARSAERATALGEDPAGPDVARARRFLLPAITVAGQKLRLKAASPGRWADDFLISARLDFTLARPRLLLRIDDGSQRRSFGPYGLSPADPDSLWSLIDDDRWFDAADAPVVARPWLVPDMAAGAVDVSALSDLWSAPVAAEPETLDALERDGLSRCDDSLFLDPRLALTPAEALAATARSLRDIDGARLFGLAAAFACAGDGDQGEPSLITAPDLVHAGWVRSVPPPLVPAEAPPAATASGDFGICAPALPAPVISAIDPLQLLGPMAVSWTMAQPGCHFILETATRPDFRNAVVVWEGGDTHTVLALEFPGQLYLRLTARKAGWLPAQAVAGVMVVASAWVVDEPANPVARYAQAAAIARRHRALIGTAAAADMLALLSLPQAWRAPDALSHASTLRAAFAAAPRPLSFASLYHPWPVNADGGTVTALPPDGAVAGGLARAARTVGAWMGQAGQPLPGIVALLPALPPAAVNATQDRFAAAGINLIKAAPDGFIAADLFSLSPETDWRFHSSRRLIMLLRRHLLRLGQQLVFEAWGDTLERLADRRLGQLADNLFRRGALAGRGGGDSWRIMIAAPGSHRDQGELVIEIAVAPQQPLRFLSVVLTRSGGALSLGGA